jgi:uncharacterized protein (DUF1684 family)
MPYNRLFTAFFLIFLCTHCKSDTDSAVQSFDFFCKSKNNAFINPTQTPLPAAEIASFAGLKYFDYNPNAAVSARVTPIVGAFPFEMMNNQNQPEMYTKAVYLDFELQGKKLRLEGYIASANSTTARTWFVPFADLTNARTTYGAGRYIDVPIVGAGAVTLDFNYAYNPYCAYNPEFVCPIPPVANRLDVSIQAGEKNYH